MILIQAHELETVKQYYINVIENTPEIDKTARWVYGKHPTDEGLRSYIENGEMFLLTDRDTVAGMVAIVMHQGTDYEDIPWAEKLENDQVATLHLLAVALITGEEPSAIQSLSWLVNWQNSRERKPYVLMCWNPTCLHSACTKRPGMNTGESSAGMLKTPDGQIFFCMKNH